MPKKLFMSNPLITSYPTQANIFSCLPNERYMEWFYEHSLNIFSLKSNTNSYVGFFSPIPWKSNPWFLSQEISNQTLATLHVDIIDFIRASIDQNYYVFLFLNRFYLKDSFYFQKQYNQHDIFVYGYDENERTIYFTDFKGHFTHCTASFDEVRMAFYSLDQEQIRKATNYIKNITLIQPIWLEWYRFDVNKIRTQLNDYMESKTSYEGYANGIYLYYEKNKDDFIFGSSVYENLINYICSLDFSKADIRGFHAILDHKVLLSSMLHYLHSKGYISFIDMEEYKKLIPLALNIRTIALKYFYSKDKSIVPRIKCLLQDIKEQEYETLAKIIISLV